MHECPNCGLHCHCNGDIDDCLMSDTKAEANCKCCDREDDENFDDYDDHHTWQGWRDPEPEDHHFYNPTQFPGGDDLPF